MSPSAETRVPKFRNDSAEIFPQSTENESAEIMRAPKWLALFETSYYLSKLETFYSTKKI